MASQRKPIRHAVTAILKAATIAEVNSNNIFSNRIEAYEKQELPAISIFTEEEDPVPYSTENKKYRRALTLRIETCVHAKSDLDDKLDDISDAIEELLLERQDLNGTAQGLTLLSTSMELSGESAESSIGVCIQVFEINYTK
ncbi:MAG: hypothetical protein RBT63_04795 [Bdellovibrionales bacterium]|jgi:hypothetical protein|nr:hypothetical protein [Bdellovibrionales bacterium]